MKRCFITAVICIVPMLVATATQAQQTDSWVVKIGAHSANPKSDNGLLADGALKADVGSDARPTITGEYMFDSNFGVEVLASLPFEHEIKLNGVKAGTVKHLPPTVSLQYHFNPTGRVSPFIGTGVNYTLFFSEHSTGPLAGTRLKLDNSWGPAAHAGIDFRLDERWLLTLDARWIKMDADVSVNGSKVGTVHIDPFIYGAAIGYRF